MASSTWTRSEDKMFEEALVFFPEGSPNRWERIGYQLQKPAGDVFQIDSGQVNVPDYIDDSSSAAGWDSAGYISFGTKHGERERKRGTPWSEDEHKLFLIGLKRYGKGDWRSISRNVLVTRTPTQVASHAQKYFLRQNSVKKERKRSSIHDITTVDTNLAMPGSNVEWTGQQESPVHTQQQIVSEFSQQLTPGGHFEDFGFGI